MSRQISTQLKYMYVQGPTSKFIFRKCFKKPAEYFLNFFFFFNLKVQSFRLIMENNFIQMASSAGNAVGPIFKLIMDCIVAVV